MDSVIAHSKTYIDNSDINAVKESMKSGLTAAGVLNNKLRESLSKYLEIEHIGLYSSGASALFNILLALDLTIDDEILLPNYICSSVLRAVNVAGATPVLYDNEENSWTSSINNIRNEITSRTRAIIINHIFGIRFPDYSIIKDLNIDIIEDCSHAFTPIINNKKVGINSIASFYSFNSTKFLAAGEGGVIATRNKDFQKVLVNNRIDPGMSDINCSFALEQINKVNFFIEKRNNIAEIYFRELKYYANPLSFMDSVYFRFPILVNNQKKFLQETHVSYRKGVDKLLSDLTNITSKPLINSQSIINKTISIPIYPMLKKREIKDIVNNVKKILCI